MRRFLFIYILLVMVGMLSAQDFSKQILVTTSGDTLKYRELLPVNYQTDEKYPLVLFLHGAGERGSDNESQLKHGSMMFTNPVNLEKYPAIVLFPQCPKESTWAFDLRPENRTRGSYPADPPVSSSMKKLKVLLDKYLVMRTVDKDRVYIIGLSMGGMGTLDMVCRYPEIFAAAIPICGGVHPGRLKKAEKVNFRIYHGDADPVVPVDNSRSVYRALKKAGTNVTYFEFPGCDHDSWNPAFNTPDFMDWLFQQKK